MRSCSESKRSWKRSLQKTKRRTQTAGPAHPLLSRLMFGLGGHGPTLASARLANGRNTATQIQPALFLAKPEQVIAVRNFAGDDLFFPLLVGYRKGKLHRFIRRVLLGKVDEFYVESLLFWSLQWHSIFLVPSWELGQSRSAGKPSQSPMEGRLALRL